MDRFTKVYVLKSADGNQFYVRECAGMEPLLWLQHGNYGHFYHRRGFDWHKSFRDEIGEEAANGIYATFDKCQRFLEENPYPWEKDGTIPFYKEHWDKP